MKKSWVCAGAMLACLAAPVQALTVFSGSDVGANAPGANSLAAAADFDAATGPLFIENFESFLAGISANGIAGPGYTITATGFEIRDMTTCGGALCGENTTLGGANFAYSTSVNALLTFDFDTPVNAFGGFFGGLQIADNSLDFGMNGVPLNASQPAQGGFAFVGFFDPDNTYNSVTLSIPADLISVDDVRFGFVQTAVPEPASWAMLVLGMFAVGGVMRSRRSATARSGPAQSV